MTFDLPPSAKRCAEYLMPQRRYWTAKNLQLLELNGADLASMNRSTFDYMWLHYAQRIRPHPDRTFLIQPEVLDSLMQGGGVLGLTAHFGAWESAAALLAKRYPGRLAALVGSIRPRAFEYVFNKHRKKLGAELIRVDDSVLEKTRIALQERKLVWLFLDHYYAGPSVALKVRGSIMRISSVPLSIASEMPSVPIVAARCEFKALTIRGRPEDGRLAELTIEKPLDVSSLNGLSDTLESILLSDPPQWQMFSRRWLDPPGAPSWRSRRGS